MEMQGRACLPIMPVEAGEVRLLRSSSTAPYVHVRLRRRPCCSDEVAIVPKRVQ